MKFFQTFPEIVSTLSTQSSSLSWSHYSILIQVRDTEARRWYEREACEQGWSVRTLQRNVSSQYYYRMLKTQKITHQDVGQMDMYIRMYDELKKQPDDTPTLGIVLCADTDEDIAKYIAKYSVMHGNEQLFASKYKLYLPTDEELREKIQTQKDIFELQHMDELE